MGQKIHPVGMRLAVAKNWSSRWYSTQNQFAATLNEDIQVRDYLKKKLAHASVGRILIERPSKSARITIFSARPGVVIGKKGEEIERLRHAIHKIIGVPVHVGIEEVRKPETDAQLIADSIAQQLERRVMFRRAMKRAMQNAMRLGAQGIKIMSAGRLNGIEIARTEWYREGRVPLHTLRANIGYAMSEAKTAYGIIGIKVWVYLGEYNPKTMGSDWHRENNNPGGAANPTGLRRNEEGRPNNRRGGKKRRGKGGGEATPEQEAVAQALTEEVAAGAASADGATVTAAVNTPVAPTPEDKSE